MVNLKNPNAIAPNGLSKRFVAVVQQTDSYNTPGNKKNPAWVD